MPNATVPVSGELPVPGDLRKTLRWATQSLREIYGDRLQRLILFGSHARGEARPESDVDVMVVLEGPVTSIKEAKRTSRIATEAASYRDTALSFIHMSEEEFADDRRPLVWSVREDGLDLLEIFSSESPPIEPSDTTGEALK
jgi:predicted nucleotidyltransferase